MIVVISHRDDPHATRVLDLLRGERQPALLLDLAELPERATLTMEYQDGQVTRLAYLREGVEFDLRQAVSVWWRRPQQPDLSSIRNGDTLAFTQNEWQEAVNGLWQLLQVPWMNPPARDEVAGRKAYQLSLAAQFGLTIPQTVITSDPEVARAFVREHGVGKTVFKTFSCTHAIWRETRLVGKTEFDLLENVRLAPVIFQEYVPGDADVRITMVGKTVFAAAIYSNATDYPVDFRMSLGQARTEPLDLPAALVQRLQAFMRHLGLVYGAIDMRRTPEGKYVFLEVNTAGEFLFIEERTGQPIGRAVADWLARPA
jgi:glutathione synthase/RimK-type ligase-like ATP-grasp enzyme